MDSAIGLFSASLVFFVFLVIIYVLIKKNIFSKNKTNEKSSLIDFNNDGKSKLAKLRKENTELTEEIKFLENKNKRLRLKIEQMKRVIKELEEQKEVNKKLIKRNRALTFTKILKWKIILKRR